MAQANQKTVRMVQLALLIALLAVLTFTPLGYLVVPPVSITFLHIPVIIGAILLGPKSGAFLGFAFGITAMVRATFAGVTPVDMMFSPFASGEPLQSLVVCLVPRILLGVIAGVLYLGLRKLLKKNAVAIGTAALIATACHTLMVLGLLSILFSAFPLKEVWISFIGINCVLEMVAAVVVSVGVCIPLQKFRRSGR